jgi:hypothetical protein
MAQTKSACRGDREIAKTTRESNTLFSRIGALIGIEEWGGRSWFAPTGYQSA